MVEERPKGVALMQGHPELSVHRAIRSSSKDPHGMGVAATGDIANSKYAWEEHMLMDEAANDNRVTELISILSTTLTNIDVEYEFELARIRITAKPELRGVIVDTVRQRHIKRREPYVRQIAELRKQMSQRHGRVACSDRPGLGSKARGA
jgi:hypothetical protein